jgi:hypothetical protein
MAVHSGSHQLLGSWVSGRQAISVGRGPGGLSARLLRTRVRTAMYYRLGRSTITPSPSLSDDPLPPASEGKDTSRQAANEAAANKARPELGRRGTQVTEGQKARDGWPDQGMACSCASGRPALGRRRAVLPRAQARSGRRAGVGYAPPRLGSPSGGAFLIPISIPIPVLFRVPPPARPELPGKHCPGASVVGFERGPSSSQARRSPAKGHTI